MRWEELYISSTGTWFPPQVTSDQAIADGRYDNETRRRTDIASVCVAEEPAVDLAVRASNIALARSPHSADEIAVLLYANANYQGIDAWNVASYVQRHTATPNAFAVELRQLSNGSMATMELAAGYLAADESRRAALLTTGDRFELPGFDRWRADLGLVWGDAGTAMVLSRDNGPARVLSLASVSDPELEGLHRGATPFRVAPSPEDMPADIERRKREFFSQMSTDEVKRRLTTGFREAMERALDDAGVSLDQVTRAVVPNFGREILEWRCLAPLKLDLSHTTWFWGRTIGHLGAGDQFAGLDHLLSSRALRPNDLVLLLGVGAGYAWTCAIVEATDLVAVGHD
ncbi:MAG: ketoacyl-ACP synthase III family protein [Micromonosporaceae bacterium]